MSETIDLEAVRLAIMEANRELSDAQRELSSTLDVVEQRERADKTMITAAMRTALARVSEAQRKLLALGIV